MGNSTRKHIRRVLAAYENHRREVVAFVFAAFLIAFGVSMVLHNNGVAASHTESVLDCRFEGVAAHSHDESCYDADGNLVCPLPEVELHAHTNDCYAEVSELACGIEEHVHDAGCYDSEGNLVCELPEHVHTDACYRTERMLVCGKDEVTTEHVHGPGCFRTIKLPDEEEVPDDGMTYDTQAAEVEEIPADAATDLAEDAEPEAAEAMPAQRFTHSIKDADDRLVLRIDVDAPEGALPVGTAMTARWIEASSLTAKQQAAVSDAVAGRAAGAIYAQQAVDIRFTDTDGAEVKPARRVAVTLTSALLDAKDLPVVARIDDLTDDELVAQAEALRGGATAEEAEPGRRAEALDRLSDSALSELGISLANNQVAVACDSPSTLVVSLTTLDHVMTAEGGTVRVEANAPAEAGLPADAELRVSELPAGTPEWVVLESDALDAAGVSASDLTRAFDVAVVRADGSAVEPLAPVSYRIKLTDAPEGQESTVVRLAGDDPELLASEADGQATAFDSDASAATYGIVYPEEISTRVITANGETYDISVTYGPEAGIPSNAVLNASEILPSDDGYDSYVERSAEALSSDVEDINHIRVFDISIRSSEDEIIEPLAPVQVKITYDQPVELEDSLGIQMVHFGEEEIEVIDAETDLGDENLLDEISFEAESFSAYAIVSTATNNLNGRTFAIINTHTHDAVQGSALNNNRLNKIRVVVNNDGSVAVTSNSSEEISTWTFTLAGNNNQYYIQNEQGQYLNINGQSVTLSNTAQALTVDARNGEVRIHTNGNNQMALNDYDNGRLESGIGAYNDNGNNEWFRLYGIEDIAYNQPNITVHYVDTSGNPIEGYPDKNIADPSLKVDGRGDGYADPYIFGDIYDLYQPIPGYAYQSTHLRAYNGTQINSEVVYNYADSWNTNNNGDVFPDQFVRAAQNRWEYQEPGRAHGTGNNYSQAVELQPFGNITDVYVVYEEGEETIPSHGGSGSGSGEQLDEPKPEKNLDPNDDGTYELSLKVRASAKEISQTNGANVILIFDMSASMGGTRISDGRWRIDAAKEATNYLVNSLLSLNTQGQSPLVEMKVIPFNITDLAQSEWLSTAAPVNNFINRLDASNVGGGTNWEAALKAAKTAADSHQDGDDTYVIFVTDGNPWMPAQVNTHDTYSRDFFEKGSYIFATEPARQIVKAGYELYGVGIYGNVDVLHLLLNFAYNGRSTYDPTPDAYGHYYLCQEQDALISALSDIAGSIEGKLSMAGVEFKDGIALSTSTKADTTMTALNTVSDDVYDTGTPVLTGITYSKEAGSTTGSDSFTVTIGTNKKAMFSINGGTPQEGTIVQKPYEKIKDDGSGTESATAYVYRLVTGGKTYEMPIATLSADGDLDWNLSPLGTLEDGATYTLITTVWPNQDAYNLVTDLNNGTADWDEDADVEVLDKNGDIAFWKGGAERDGHYYEHIVKYPNGTYAALSNTYQTLDYYVVDTEGGETTYTQGPTIEMDYPDPMGLRDEMIALKKEWDKDMMPSADTPSVTLDLLRDDSEFISGIVLNQANGWTVQKYIAPGMMITKAEADRKGISGQVVSYNGGENNYVILNTGYNYQFVEEKNPETAQFELEKKIYHPMLVEIVDDQGHSSSVLKNVVIDGTTITPTDDDLSQGLVAYNVLKGGINIKKVVKDAADNVITDSDDVFDVVVTLTAPMNEDGTPDFTNVEDEYAEDSQHHYIIGEDGKYVIATPSVAWYRYLDSNDRPVAADALPFEDTAHHKYGSWFMLDFDNDTGIATGTVKIHPAYTLRFLNMASGTSYSVVETAASAAGYEVSYEYTHQAYVNGQPGNPVPDEGDTHVVVVDQANNVTVINKQVKSDLILIKADEDGNPITSEDDVATFKLTKNTASDGSGTWENAVDIDNNPHLIVDGTVTINSTDGVTLRGLSDGLYQLKETKSPDGYIIPDGPVTFMLSGGDVTFVEITSRQEEVDGEQTTVWTVTPIKTPAGYTLIEKTSDTPIVGIKINNTPGAELPHSGGRGVRDIYATGIAMIAGAMAYLIFRRKKELA